MKKVLYVDDAPSIRKLVYLVLHEQFDLTLAENGQEGLDAIEKQPFDVIISDVTMPVMDGLEFLQKLRQHKNSKETPTLMLITESDPELKEQAKALGANGWIVKPFDPIKLIHTLQQLTL